MRIIVTGDQTFDDQKLLFKKLDVLTIKLATVEIAITGQNTYLGNSTVRCGVEYHAAKWCAKWKYTYFVYHTDVYFAKDKNGPEKRLRQMFEDSDVAVIFWDGSCKKTKELIRMARKTKTPLRVYPYED